MTNYTDTQLKIALAKMLPELVCIKHYDCKWADCLEHFPNGTDILSYIKNTVAVSDTELLHLCWLVEETLSIQEQQDFIFALVPTYSYWQHAHTTWQQRTIALAKVKRVEII